MVGVEDRRFSSVNVGLLGPSIGRSGELAVTLARLGKARPSGLASLYESKSTLRSPSGDGFGKGFGGGNGLRLGTCPDANDGRLEEAVSGRTKAFGGWYKSDFEDELTSQAVFSQGN